MKKKIVSILLAFSLIVPVTANAGFLSNLVAQFGYQISLSANETLELYDAMSKDMNAMAANIDAMANKILEMADKIGEMADRILVMADKIGEMADRIVATEQLMADLTLNMATLSADVVTIKENTSGSTVSDIYIDNAGQTDLYNQECPTFTISDAPAEYVVYVSSSLTMSTNTISVLVHNQAELEALWPSLITLAANGKIYIGVKSINNNQISSLSNILGYNVL